MFQCLLAAFVQAPVALAGAGAVQSGPDGPLGSVEHPVRGSDRVGLAAAGGGRCMILPTPAAPRLAALARRPLEGQFGPPPPSNLPLRLGQQSVTVRGAVTHHAVLDHPVDRLEILLL